MRILLVDDHPLFRQGVRSLLSQSFPDASFGEAGCVADARDALNSSSYDVIIVDISLPDGDGLSLAQEVLLKQLKPRIFILSMHRRSAFIHQARDLGCRGYFLKEGDGAALIQAIRVNDDGFHVSDNLRELLVASLKDNPANERYTRLTRREKEILRLFAGGLGYKEVASKLRISPSTASVHRYNIFQKLEITNDVDMVRLATDLGLIV